LGKKKQNPKPNTFQSPLKLNKPALSYKTNGNIVLLETPIYMFLGIKYRSPGIAGEQYFLQCVLSVFCLIILLWSLVASILEGQGHNPKANPNI